MSNCHSSTDSSTAIKLISGAPNAPQAIGPYSQVAKFGNLHFLSGQIPLNPETGALVGEGIEEQTEQVLKNIAAVLNHIGAKFTDIAKSTIFVTDLAHFKTVNGIYERALGGHKPARSTVQVAALPMGAKVEIEVVVCR
jgi:2-iminobutanoate/2-iminopropanoate deaminase